MENEVSSMNSGMDSKSEMFTVFFTDIESAEQAYNDLLEKGYTQEEVNLAMSDTTHKKHFLDKLEVKDSVSTVAEDAKTGGAIGAVAGATLAVLTIGSSIVVPGLGLVLAGPFAAALAGAGAGGVSGSIIGALIGAGVPEAHAEIIETSVKKGKIVISFRPHNVSDIAFFERRWKKHIDVTA